MRSPSNSKYKNTNLYYNITNYTGSVTFQTYDESGSWMITNIEVYDIAGNCRAYYYEPGYSTYVYYENSTYYDSGFALIYISANTSGEDIDRPVLNSIAASPLTITGSGTVNITATATDVGTSGLNNIWIQMRSPSNSKYKSTNLYYNITNYTGSVTFQTYDESGSWMITNIEVYDNAGNCRAYYYEPGYSTYVYYENSTYYDSGFAFIYISANTSGEDIDKPVLNSITASPLTITGSGTLNFMATAADVGTSGLNIIWVQVRSPSNSQYLNTNLTYNASNYTGSVTFESYHETGTWMLTNIEVYDIAGNCRAYNYEPGYSTYVYYENSTYYDSGFPLIYITKN